MPYRILSPAMAALSPEEVGSATADMKSRLPLPTLVLSQVARPKVLAEFGTKATHAEAASATATNIR